MTNKKRILFASFVGTTLSLAACITDPFTGESRVSNTVTGGASGAAAGAAIGAAYAGITMLDGNPRNDVDPRVAAIAGAGIGLVVGLFAGNELDRQEEQLRQELQEAGVSVSRRGENIVLNMDRAIQFASGATTVGPDAHSVLRAVALSLNEFDGTLVDVLGFTDNEGAQAANKHVSEQRAFNVARILVDFGVDAERLGVAGRGEAEPVASNSTAAGRARNRRVEIHIQPIR